MQNAGMLTHDMSDHLVPLDEDLGTDVASVHGLGELSVEDAQRGTRRRGGGAIGAFL